MRSIATLFQGSPRSPEAASRLEGAYSRLFAGKGNDEDAEIVLTDILAYSGFFDVTGDVDALPMSEGRRQVGARILRLIKLPQQGTHGAVAAAMYEAIISDREGSKL